MNQFKYDEVVPKKFSDWVHFELLAPPKISMEQGSSAFSAKIKAEMVSGKSMLDLSAGMGVDAYYFAQNFKEFTHNEPNEILSDIAKYNFKTLGINNVCFTQQNAEEFEFIKKYDWIYLDPDRRNAAEQKVFKLSDCKPNLIEILPKLLQFSNNIMVKLSPMLDIKACIAELDFIKEVLIISEKNEVKELVLIIEKGYSKLPSVKCIESTNEPFEFNFENETNEISEFQLPQKYLYEPNSSILKAGGFKSVGAKYGLKKLAIHSHLYTNNEIVENFPGRKFEIVHISKFDKKVLNNLIISKKANISCRNFPIGPDEIKKKLAWKDGGEQYVFFTENTKKEKIVLICSKII